MIKETQAQMAVPKITRGSILQTVRLRVLTESGYMCSNPRCKHMLTLELHHLDWVKDGGGNESSNLVALCSNCHDLHTRGHIPKVAIDAWKQMLMLVNGALDRDSLDLLIFMYDLEKRSSDTKLEWEKWYEAKQESLEKLQALDETTQRELREHDERWNESEPPSDSEQPLIVSGDGLLRLVRLIRTGLVDPGKQEFSWSHDFGQRVSWEPKLTQTGRWLADAFMDGDSKTFREILAGNI